MRRTTLGKPDAGYGLLLLGEKIVNPDLYSKSFAPHVGIINLFGKTIILDAWTRIRDGRQVLLLKVRESAPASPYRRPEDRAKKRRPVQDYVNVKWDDEFNFGENK